MTSHTTPRLWPDELGMWPLVQLREVDARALGSGVSRESNPSDSFFFMI